VIKTEKMSGEAAVNLGGLDGPALYYDEADNVIRANEAAIELLGADWEEVATSLVNQAATRSDVDDAHHCLLIFGAQKGAGRHFVVHLSRDEVGCRLLLISEELATDLIPSARLEEILESIKDCFFALDSGGTFVYANSHAAEFMGVPRDEILGRTLESFHPMDAVFSEARDRAMIAKEATTYNSHLSVGDQWIEVRAYPAGDGMAVYFSDVTDRVQTQDELAFLALHDSLTRLPNRRLFQDQLRRAVSRAKRGVPSALLFLDMDRFKNVNDTVGHAAGDDVLVEFVRVVSSCAREEDTFARFGGDEFALLLENTTLDDALMVAERIQTAVKEHAFAAADCVFSLGVSIGLTTVFGTGGGGHVMALADTAMYEAKRMGGEQIRVLTAPAEVSGVVEDA
jgi:diguanylate cyclase (GGDEF)-like protein/PAS domain S-box-containing protein